MEVKTGKFYRNGNDAIGGPAVYSPDYPSKDECAHGPTDGFDESEWISRDDFKEAVAHDSLWEIQWYPNSPVGFCTAYGSTFENAMMCANQ